MGDGNEHGYRRGFGCGDREGRARRSAGNLPSRSSLRITLAHFAHHVLETGPFTFASQSVPFPVSPKSRREC
ncbi:hypothetical protein NSU_3885 [Novosphingobium pentaromativorans US6-1]|uniref:Uncharacterized protein n=1 Tax=Novosphingobium pentaromativorans US6-1 TaxID=1088721 RepID=G6EHR3_9SPHN|nr:hypothetical protein NSU_3885 [Novosphingobium pentaromativorans US6-1]